MKKLISFAMALIIVFVGFACVMPRSFAAEPGLLTYAVTDGKACITGTTGTITGDFTVPAEIDGYPVVEIGEGAFAKQTGLTSVTISEGIETVGSDCFSDCYNLVKLTVPQLFRVCRIPIRELLKSFRYHRITRSFILIAVF